MRTRTLLLLIALVAGEHCRCSSTWAWQVNLNGTASLNDEVHAVTIDSNGDVLAAGTTQNSGASTDFTVVKLSGATGATIWRRIVAGTAAAPSGEGRAIALDAAGNAFAAGFIANLNTLQDFTVVKLAGTNGAEMWRSVTDGTANVNDLARTIRVDAAGNVVAGGALQNTGTGKDFAVLKLSGTTGAEMWRRQINGSASLDDLARSVRLTPTGDVVVGGELRNTGSTDFAVVKLAAATGAELWRHVIDGTAAGTDVLHSVRIDAAGDVVAAGELQNIGTGMDFAVVKLSGATGAEVWRRQLDGTASLDDLVRSVRVDAAGDVIAAGELQNIGTGMDFTIVKLSGGTGAEVWRQVLKGSASGNDAAHAVRVEPTGDVLACGALQNTGTDLDFTVVKLSGSDGTPIWRREINGTGSGADQASALAEDSSGDVVAAGFTQNVTTNMDFTVVKLRGSDGGDFVAQATTTTTTTLPAPNCSTIPECEAVLASALPPAHGANSMKTRKVARQLSRLDHKLNRLLDHAGTARIKKQHRLYKKARGVLVRVLAAVQAADSQGSLGVPVAAIEAAISGLLTLLPS